MDVRRGITMAVDVVATNRNFPKIHGASQSFVHIRACKVVSPSEL